MNKPLQIITVPHPSLRQTAQPITELTQPVIHFLHQLGQTLKKTRNPQGVGLAAPQVDTLWQAFYLYLPPTEDGERRPTPSTTKLSAQLQPFLNPRIVKTSAHHTLGPDVDEPIMEGCLSIPSLYGPVPRWEWIELEYQTIQGDALVERKDRFSGFKARVIQHEYDHLFGVLFTDYSLRYELPVYQKNPQTKTYDTIDPSILASW